MMYNENLHEEEHHLIQPLAERKINRWKRERPRHCASGTVSGAFFRVLVMSQFI